MALTEGFILNGLNLNSGPEPSGPYTLEALDLTPPKKKPEFAQSSDSDGAALIRTPLYENRTITAKVRIEPQTTMNGALEKLGAIIDQLQEAEKNPDGIPLEWTPGQATKTLTFYVLEGEVTGIPINVQGDEAGWFVKAPLLTLALVCKPFGYGEEVSAGAATSNETGLSIVTFTVGNVPGDVPAEGRLVVTDTAAVGRRYVEWGLENRYYDASTDLVLDSEDMIPVAGSQSTAHKGYRRPGATKDTIFTLLLPEPTICCSTGNLKHVGTFRVKLRIFAEGETSHVRLSWRAGEGPFRSNGWTEPKQLSEFGELDLGVITVPPALAGAQKWEGRIEAYSDGEFAASAIYVDYLVFIPVGDGYGKARGVQPSQSGAVVAYDDFTTGTSHNLNGRSAPIGGTWSTSGAPTDFFANVATQTAERGTTGDKEPRFALLGSAQTNLRTAAIISGYGGNAVGGVVARWVSATEYLALQISRSGETEYAQIIINGGVYVTVIVLPSATPATTRRLVLTVLADGTVTGEVQESNGTTLARLATSNSLLATGGTLASGKCGYLDFLVGIESAPTRHLRSLEVVSLSEVPYCVQPSRSMEARSDSAITTDSTGTYYGPVPEYRGARFFVPQAGEANRTSRILVKADRNDLEEAAQQVIADGFTAEAFYTPRFAVIPR